MQVGVTAQAAKIKILGTALRCVADPIQAALQQGQIIL